MKTYQFKTNIKCGGCIAAVTPHFNENPDIQKWEVDISGPSRILTVETDKLEAQDISKVVEKAGYKAELL